MKTNPVVVFVSNDEKSQATMTDNNMLVFRADTLRDALAQIVFSYPDVIVIDASDDMLRAEDVYFHLRSIQHPPVLILSDVPARWDTAQVDNARVLPQDSDMVSVIAEINSLLGRQRTVA